MHKNNTQIHALAPSGCREGEDDDDWYWILASSASSSKTSSRASLVRAVDGENPRSGP